jgi:prepilin-type N-terminal cleavage/methylation domain-containing protein
VPGKNACRVDNNYNYGYYICETMKCSSSSRGFTLVELLITVLLVAVLVVGATARLSGMNNAASETRDEQNAQMLASLAISAQAAGLDFVDRDGDVGRTVAAISEGATVTRGAFAGQFFGLQLGSVAAERAMSYLRIQDGMLVYLGSQGRE